MTGHEVKRNAGWQGELAAIVTCQLGRPVLTSPGLDLGRQFTALASASSSWPVSPSRPGEADQAGSFAEARRSLLPSARALVAGPPVAFAWAIGSVGLENAVSRRLTAFTVRRFSSRRAASTLGALASPQKSGKSTCEQLSTVGVVLESATLRHRWRKSAMRWLDLPNPTDLFPGAGHLRARGRKWPAQP